MTQVIDKQTHRIYRETCYYTSYSINKLTEYTGKPAIIQVIDKQTHRIYREPCYDTSYR